MKDDKIYLLHILDAIESIEDYLTETDDDELFKQNRLVFDAVIRNLSIIGEAANNLSSDFVKKYPELPFKSMIGMRNVVVHDYFGINTKVIWETCKEDLPMVKDIVTKILSS